MERVEIKDVRLPVSLQRAMAAEAEATREAKAKVRYLNEKFMLSSVRNTTIRARGVNIWWICRRSNLESSAGFESS